MNALSMGEERRLSQLERQIEASGRQMIEALKTIHDTKLYRAHGTFEDYCQKRWGMGKSQAYRLMSHANIVALLSHDPKTSPMGDKITERATREIADLPPETQVEIVKTACQETGKPTAKAIRAARECIAPKKKTVQEPAKELSPCPHCMGTGYA